LQVCSGLDPVTRQAAATAVLPAPPTANAARGSVAKRIRAVDAGVPATLPTSLAGPHAALREMSVLTEPAHAQRQRPPLHRRSLRMFARFKHATVGITARRFPMARTNAEMCIKRSARGVKRTPIARQSDHYALSRLRTVPKSPSFPRFAHRTRLPAASRSPRAPSSRALPPERRRVRQHQRRAILRQAPRMPNRRLTRIFVRPRPARD
jgi:hypothetical protein